MGDVLLAGKQYLGTAEPGHVYGHGHLYGYFGDPTMQLWLEPPDVLFPASIFAEIRRDTPPIGPPGPGPGPPPFWVRVVLSQPVPEGAFVSLEQKDGKVVGRGFIQNGQAVIIPRVGQVNTLGLQVKVQADGFFAAQKTVPGQ